MSDMIICSAFGDSAGQKETKNLYKKRPFLVVSLKQRMDACILIEGTTQYGKSRWAKVWKKENIMWELGGCMHVSATFLVSNVPHASFSIVFTGNAEHKMRHFLALEDATGEHFSPFFVRGPPNVFFGTWLEILLSFIIHFCAQEK
jgi:hypothetical protein